MPPITDRTQAKKGGFAQVRDAIQEFTGDCIDAHFDKWADTVDRKGKDYLEVVCDNLEITRISEELSFFPASFSFRVNASEYEGSFWMDEFLLSADNNKLLIPDDLVGKRIKWVKVSKTYNIQGQEVTVTNFIIAGIVAPGAPAQRVRAAATSQPQPAAVPTPGVEVDLMAMAADIADGKTEAQFKSAISLNPAYAKTPLLTIAKSGLLAEALIKEGKIKKVQEGNKTIFRKV